jgi:hypothetical protein
MIFTRSSRRLVFRSVLLFLLSAPGFPGDLVAQGSAPGQIQVVECVLLTNLVQNGARREVEVGRLDLVLAPDSVSGQFSAEYQSGGGTYRFSGSFGNGKYGTKLAGDQFGTIKVLEDKERKNGFAASGQYTATFEPAGAQGGRTPEMSHHTCTFEISGYRQARSWQGLIESDPVIDEGTPHPRHRCPGHIVCHFRFRGPTPLLTQRSPEPKPEPKRDPCANDAEWESLAEAISDVTKVQLITNNATCEIASHQPLLESYRLEIAEALSWVRPTLADNRALEAADRIRLLNQNHQEICRQQDAIVAGMIRQYRELDAAIRDKGFQAECPEVKTALSSLWRDFRESRDLNEVKMYFVSGQREKFQALARDVLNRGIHKYQVTWLLGEDRARSGEMGSALYDFRGAQRLFLEELAKYGPDGVPKELAQQRPKIEKVIGLAEISFLETVDRKVMGDAATVRGLLLEELERGEPGLWNWFTRGIITAGAGFGFSRTWWFPISLESNIEARADSAGMIMEDAATQHLGLSIILRLRRKDHTLEEIKRADNATLIRWVAEGFGGQVLSPQRAIRLRSLIYQGFQNPDMIRLMSGSLEEFERFPGRPYYTTEEFERAWYEGVSDFFLNPLMLTSMFVSSALVTSETGKFLWLPKYMTPAEAAASKSLVQTAASRLGVPELIRSATAQNAILAERIRSVIQWNQEASFLKRLFVQGMVQTGAVRVATAVGGLPGQVVAEVLTTLGAGDLDEAAKILQSSGVTNAAARAVAQDMKKVVEGFAELRTQAQVVGHRNTVTRLLARLDSGEILDDVVKAQLRASAQSLDDLVRIQAREIGSDLIRAQTNQLRLTAHALRTLESGDRARTRFLVSFIDKEDVSIVQMAQEMQEGIKVADKAYSLRAPLTPEPVLPSPGEAKVPTATDKACKHVSDMWKRHDATFRPVNEALKRGDIDSALAESKAAITRWNTQLDTARAAGNAGRMEEVADELMLHLECHGVIQDMREAKLHIKPFGKAAEDTLTHAISEIAPIKAELDRIFDKVRAGDSTIDELLPILKTSEDEITKDAPRLLVANGQRFVLKDYTDNIIKGKGELFATKLANEVDISTPGCAEISWLDAKGKTTRYVLVQRFVPDASDLGKVDRGTALAVKEHIARDRVVSMLLGDHDRRSRNFLVTASGRVYCIDRGESAIIENLAEWQGTVATKAHILFGLERRHGLYLSEMRQKWVIIDAINMFISPEDIKKAIDRVKELTDTDLERLLNGVFEQDSDDYKRAFLTLKTRRDGLKELFFPVAEPVTRDEDELLAGVPRTSPSAVAAAVEGRTSGRRMKWDRGGKLVSWSACGLQSAWPGRRACRGVSVGWGRSGAWKPGTDGHDAQRSILMFRRAHPAHQPARAMSRRPARTRFQGVERIGVEGEASCD